MDSYDPRYLRGIDYFNRQAYFASHEVWEDLWRDDLGEAHLFYKGLIQAAVALHHLGRGNRHGADKLLSSSRQCLAAYGPKYMGLDVGRLLADVTSCCQRGVARPVGESPDRWPPPKIVLETPDDRENGSIT